MGSPTATPRAWPDKTATTLIRAPDGSAQRADGETSPRRGPAPGPFAASAAAAAQAAQPVNGAAADEADPVAETSAAAAASLVGLGRIKAPPAVTPRAAAAAPAPPHVARAALTAAAPPAAAPQPPAAAVAASVSGAPSRRKKRNSSRAQRLLADIAVRHVDRAAGYAQVRECVARIRAALPESHGAFDHRGFLYWKKKELAARRLADANESDGEPEDASPTGLTDEKAEPDAVRPAPPPASTRPDAPAAYFKLYRKRRDTTPVQRYLADVARRHVAGERAYAGVRDCIVKIRVAYPDTHATFDRSGFRYWTNKELLRLRNDQYFGAAADGHAAEAQEGDRVVADRAFCERAEAPEARPVAPWAPRLAHQLLPPHSMALAMRGIDHQMAHHAYGRPANGPRAPHDWLASGAAAQLGAYGQPLGYYSSQHQILCAAPRRDPRTDGALAWHAWASPPLCPVQPGAPWPLADAADPAPLPDQSLAAAALFPAAQPFPINPQQAYAPPRLVFSGYNSSFPYPSLYAGLNF
ncbi:hypothetical protein M885DRAFT_524869 [Pelagophyceae sp. CCMP2097]|nr:hypothetical protein M885DRAFT_524869 [Pelagophyceae sp. CCMP2097]